MASRDGGPVADPVRAEPADDTGGQPAIPADAHIRLASHEHNSGTRILRRGYSFTDGIAQVRSLLNVLPSPFSRRHARMYSSGHGTMEPL
jgi:deferrochelatase/peroxidase EfeB